ncbi:MAG TPA: M3 family peptidase, partial [Gammaproteobacteria bacterium]|nr:M3 family peptidase [Gammaproteobacteria bacterium]
MLSISRLLALLIIANLSASCGESKTSPAPDTSAANSASADLAVSEAELQGNPFRATWQTPFGVPPFAEIETADYLPAVKKALQEMRAEIDVIVSNTEPATFTNTIMPLEVSGKSLNKVAYTFSNITGTDTNDELRALQTQIYPMLTREADAITLNDVLYQRVNAVFDARDSLNLGEQEARLLELTHRGFLRAGAAFAPEVKNQIAAINEEVSKLTTQFAQNLLLETKAFKLVLKTDEDTAGLSSDFKAAIYDEEQKAWIVGLNRSAYESFMVQSTNRALREELFNGYRLRASEGERDNGPLAIRIAQLRAERATLMGYESHAH